jgi:hypothetical protein
MVRIGLKNFLSRSQRYLGLNVLTPFGKLDQLKVNPFFFTIMKWSNLPNGEKLAPKMFCYINS